MGINDVPDVIKRQAEAKLLWQKGQRMMDETIDALINEKPSANLKDLQDRLIEMQVNGRGDPDILRWAISSSVTYPGQKYKQLTQLKQDRLEEKAKEAK